MLPFDMIFSAVGAAGKMEGASLSLKDGTADGQGGGQFSSVLNATIDPDADLAGENGELPLDVPYELFGLQAQPLPVRFAFAAGLSLTGTGEGQAQDSALAPQLPDGGDVPILSGNGKGASDLLQGAGAPPVLGGTAPDGDLLAAAGINAGNDADALQPVSLKPAASPAGAPVPVSGGTAPETASQLAKAPRLATAGDGIISAAPLAGALDEAAGPSEVAAGRVPLTASTQASAAQQPVVTAPALQDVQQKLTSDRVGDWAGNRGGEHANAGQKLAGEGARLLREVQGQGSGLGVTAKKWQSGLPQELRATVASLVVGQTPAAAKLVETPAAVQPTVLTTPAQDAALVSDLTLAASNEQGLAPVAEDVAGEFSAAPRASATGGAVPQGQATAGPSVTSTDEGAAASGQIALAKTLQQDKTGLLPANVDDAPVAELAEGDVDPGEQPPAATATKKAAPAAAGTTPRDVAGQQQTGARADLVAVAPSGQPLSKPEGELEFEFDPEAIARLSGTGGDTVSVSRADTAVRPGQVQSSHVAMQVAGEIARNLQNGNTRFQMRFDPPELGRVDVKMKVSADGKVHAHLIVERPETLDLFMRDQRGLERALEAAGLTADSENMKFSLKDQGSSGFQFSEGRDQSQERGSDRPGTGREPTLEDDDYGPGVRMNLTARAGGLDVRI